MSNVRIGRSITRETPETGASMLLAVRLSDLERRAIGYRLSGRPIDAGNRAASEVLHRELHRVLQDLVMEYRESLVSEHATTGLFLVSKEGSGVWHVPKDEPERVTNGWQCSTMCDGRKDVFDQVTVRAGTSVLGLPERDDVGDEERLCRKCARQIEKDGGL